MLCDFQNFIVYVFRQDAGPSLIATNRGVPRMRDSRASGLYRMRDIMPEAFPQSEFYRRFYKFTDVSDELRYIVRPD